ncbi:MAG: hypothetical protein ACJ76F_12190 [Bacteroidia bacterium]
MQKLAGSVEELIKKSVAEFNAIFPHKKLITCITNMGNPRRLAIQSRDTLIHVTISQLVLNLPDQKLPHLEVRISKGEQEHNFEYFSLKEVWWSTEKKCFCDMEEIQLSMNSLLEMNAEAKN